MLPNLHKLSFRNGGVSTGAWLKDAQWGALECAICYGPLSADTPDPQNKWPFPDEHFLATACVTGHVYHKGCLKSLVRSGASAVCPECRKPILAEVQRDLLRDTPGEAEARGRRNTLTPAERMLAANRAERERVQRNARGRAQDRALQEEGQEPIWRVGFDQGEGPQNRNDHRIVWTFYLKGDVDEDPVVREAMRAVFAENMRLRYTGRRVGHWGRRLCVWFSDMNINVQGRNVDITKAFCQLFLPSYAVGEVLAYFDSLRQFVGYSDMLQMALGINGGLAATVADYPTNRGGYVREIEGAHPVAAHLAPPPPFANLTEEQWQQWQEWSQVGAEDLMH